MDAKTHRAYYRLSDFIRTFYENRILEDDIISIHSGHSQEGEWVAVLQKDGKRDFWTRNWPRSAFDQVRWQVRSMRVHKTAKKEKKEPTHSVELGQLRRKARCRLCGAAHGRGEFVKAFLSEGVSVFIVCQNHPLIKGMEQQLWERKRAPSMAFVAREKKKAKLEFSRVVRSAKRKMPSSTQKEGR